MVKALDGWVEVLLQEVLDRFRDVEEVQGTVH